MSDYCQIVCAGWREGEREKREKKSSSPGAKRECVSGSDARVTEVLQVRDGKCVCVVAAAAAADRGVDVLSLCDPVA